MDSVDNFLDTVSAQSSSTEIDLEKLKVFTSKLPIWEFTNITMSKYDNFRKDDNGKLPRYD